MLISAEKLIKQIEPLQKTAEPKLLIIDDMFETKCGKQKSKEAAGMSGATMKDVRSMV